MRNATNRLLVPMKIKPGNLAPVFAIPGAGGNVSGFMELIEALDLPNSIYGLQPSGLDGLAPPYKSVAEAVEHYMEEMIDLMPGGPLHLLGHSFGGWVALELGLRLSKIGRRVESLVIMDSDLPNPIDTPPTTDEIAIVMAFV